MASRPAAAFFEPNTKVPFSVGPERAAFPWLLLLAAAVGGLSENGPAASAAAVAACPE